ncbi:hypothetical protein, partial [Acinetobacter baumannii]|uniref:hypothetical protein n=1 Tax=Acinetobacter baumannii TaxID=470 RepID=UPI0022233C91
PSIDALTKYSLKPIISLKKRIIKNSATLTTNTKKVKNIKVINKYLIIIFALKITPFINFKTNLISFF